MIWEDESWTKTITWELWEDEAWPKTITKMSLSNFHWPASSSWNSQSADWSMRGHWWYFVIRYCSHSTNWKYTNKHVKTHPSQCCRMECMNCAPNNSCLSLRGDGVTQLVECRTWNPKTWGLNHVRSTRKTKSVIFWVKNVANQNRMATVEVQRVSAHH